jgi:hypothetical protein
VAQLPQNSQTAYLFDFRQSSSDNSASPAVHPGSGHSKIKGMGTPISNIPSGIGTPVSAMPQGIGTPVGDRPKITSDSQVAGLGAPVDENSPASRPGTDGSAPRTSEEIQRIGWAFAQSLKAAIGDKVSTGQLQFLITTHHQSLIRGQQFDVGPILGALKQAAAGDVEGVFRGLVRFRSVLVGMGLEMRLPDLGIDEETQQQLLTQARTQNAEAFRAGGLHLDEADIGPLPGEPVPGKGTGPTKKEDQLAEFNLAGQEKNESKAKLAKWVGLILIMIAASVVAWFAQPHQTLRLGEYQAIFPVTQVESYNGIFVGYLDDLKWQNLTQTERQVAVRKLEEKLTKKGFLNKDSTCQSMCRQVAIMNSEDKLIVFDIHGGKLKSVMSP